MTEDNGFILETDFDTIIKAQKLAYSRGKKAGDSYASELWEVIEQGGKGKILTQEQAKKMIKDSENIVDLTKPEEEEDEERDS